jgi:CRP-like cAMP-binding protein
MGSDASPLRHELNALLNQYRTALQRDPENPTLLADVGGILRKLGRSVEALGCYRDAAQAYMAAGQILEVAKTCGRIMRIDPEDRAARDLVERIQQEALLAPENLKQALSGTIRKQRVVDGPPVVVLPAGAAEEGPWHKGLAGPDQESWDETVERPMPPLRPLDDVPTLFEDGASPDDEPTVRGSSEDATAKTVQPASTPEQDALPSDLFPAELVQRGARHIVQGGEAIISEGDPGDDLFVLLRGRAEVSKQIAGGSRAVIESIAPGAFFGELGLLGDGQRHATVTALEASEVLVLDRRSIRARLKAAPALNRALLASYRERLQRMLRVAAPVFAAMSDEDASRVLSQCKPVRRRAGDIVLQAGEGSPGVHMILLGVVEVRGERPDVLTDGGVFGAEALLQGRPSAATFVCSTFCQLMLWPEEAVSRFAAERPDLLDLLGATSMD